MSVLHEVIGYTIVGAFALLMLVGLVTWLMKRKEPWRWFWWILAYAQVVVGLQVIAGIVLLIMGERRDLLHYAYGGIFPILVLTTAHVVSRMEDRPAYVNFAWAAFFCFGLTLRALMTGLGVG